MKILCKDSYSEIETIKTIKIDSMLIYPIGALIYYVDYNKMTKRYHRNYGKIVGYQIKIVDNEVKIGIDLKSRSNIPINRVSDNKYTVDSIIFDLINKEEE